eukprot:scaffold693_cov200-Alexandrium_tamarense.AAC.89
MLTATASRPSSARSALSLPSLQSCVVSRKAISTATNSLAFAHSPSPSLRQSFGTRWMIQPMYSSILSPPLKISLLGLSMSTTENTSAESSSSSQEFDGEEYEEESDGDDDSFFVDEHEPAIQQDSSASTLNGNTFTQADAPTLDINSLPVGIPPGYHIIQHGTIPPNPSSNPSFSAQHLSEMISTSEIDRLGISSENMTIPVALMLLFPDQFDTLTKGRKECRRKKILICRGVEGDKEGGEVEFDLDRMSIGTVGDRV